eukprot:7348504-Prymnesium_polylepis.1
MREYCAQQTERTQWLATRDAVSWTPDDSAIRIVATHGPGSPKIIQEDKTADAAERFVSRLLNFIVVKKTFLHARSGTHGERAKRRRCRARP